MTEDPPAVGQRVDSFCLLSSDQLKKCPNSKIVQKNSSKVILVSAIFEDNTRFTTLSCNRLQNGVSRVVEEESMNLVGSSIRKLIGVRSSIKRGL